MTTDATWRLTARESLARLQAGTLSASDLVEGQLARIALEDGWLKSFITVSADRARDEARASDERRKAGEPAGPLEGLPFAVKDLTDTADIRTTYGSTVFRDHVPTADELSVARLRAAGGILLGKTNTPEFGSGARSINRLFGPTANPYDPALTSGGSSGGSAAAVAAGLVPFAQGTDFGGSVRTPASFCGIVGVRPTPGLIPTATRPLGWNVMVTQGVLARTVDDARLLLGAMIGHDPRDPLSRPGSDDLDQPDRPIDADLRVGFTPDFGVAPVAEDVRGLFDDAVSLVSTLFPATEAASPDCGDAMATFATLRAAISHRQAEFVARHRDQLSGTFVWNVERGAGLSADDYLAADEARTRLFARFMHFFETHDILIAPAASILPFSNQQDEVMEIDGRRLASPIDYLAITYIVSLVGLPCLSIPAGSSRGGLPFGLQIIAPPYREARLLAFAERLERDLGFRHRWPDQPLSTLDMP